MSANVIVSGRSREAGGLKESLAKFTKYQAEVGAALLNISGIGVPADDPQFPDGRDENDPRPAYNSNDPRNQWPRMVYHAERGELTVLNEAELKESRRQGYRDEPYLKPQVAVADPATEKKVLQAQLATKDGEIATLNDTLQKVVGRLEKIESDRFDDKSKKG